MQKKNPLGGLENTGAKRRREDAEGTCTHMHLHKNRRGRKHRGAVKTPQET